MSALHGFFEGRTTEFRNSRRIVCEREKAWLNQIAKVKGRNIMKCGYVIPKLWPFCYLCYILGGVGTPKNSQEMASRQISFLILEIHTKTTQNSEINAEGASPKKFPTCLMSTLETPMFRIHHHVSETTHTLLAWRQNVIYWGSLLCSSAKM